MSRTVKRRLSSMSYSFNKLYRRVSTTKPSTFILSIISMAIAIFLFGGGLYDIIVRPYAAIYTGSYFVFLYPQLSEQFISDSIVAIILYTLGTIGSITIYQSTKYSYKPRQAYITFIVGMTLLLAAYVLLEATIQIKIG